MDAFGALISFALAVLLVLFEMSVIYPLPLSDIGAVRYRTMPTMTYLLIIVNALVFIAWQAPDIYGVELDSYRDLQPYMDKIWTYGYRDVFMTEGLSIGAFTTFTSMFMHGDIWHLFGNMIFLWAFGRRLEDACGPWRYLLFYLTAGMVANLGSVVLNPVQGELPSVGASGAIAGVMGAFLVLFPRARIQCLWFIGMILWIPYRAITRQENIFSRYIVLPAGLFLLYFAFRELLPSLETITQGDNVGGVNNLAHLLGFAAGPLILLFVRKDLLVRFITRRAV
ncbi:MAG: rhomboid family intramembrane serine protease [Anaerolineae bacterium]|nr:rhomboid family intramembrane serine protease [Anaerolineae bacterium]NUQ07203.1 rhomboid family intramembrane serine protease [Anaerolineae bacterium]